MSSEKAEITIAYDPEEDGAQIRCDFAGDDPDDRDARVQALFDAVRDTATEELETKGLQPLAGGEVTGENAVSYAFGTEDDVVQL
jgi:hypothetical protein